MFKKIYGCLLLTAVTFSTIYATPIPLGLEPIDFIYNKIERNETLESSFLHHSVAPFLLADSSSYFDDFPFLKTKKNQLNIFFMGNEFVQAQENSKPLFYETLRAGVNGKLSDNIYFYSNISLDESKAIDINYSGKKWRGLAGGIEQSFLTAQFKNFDMHFGRFKSFWGFEKSLLLSASNALDGFQYSYKYKKLKLSYRFAKLEQLQTDLQTSVFDNRFFTSHRLDIQLHKKLSVGIFESVIFGGVGRTIEFKYLNPLTSYHVEQLNANVNDNSFIGFDFLYYPYKQLKIYGQLLVDDFQIEKETQGDQEPNEYGFILGVYKTNIIESYDLRTEYIKITNRTYNQAYERNRYTFENRSLGYFDENDFDKFNLTISKWFLNQNRLSVNFSYKRKGEGDINRSWDEPWMEVDGDYSEPFPFGVVEKTTHISLEYQGFVYRNFFISAVTGYEDIQNKYNIETYNDSNSFVQLSVSAFLFGSVK